MASSNWASSKKAWVRAQALSEEKFVERETNLNVQQEAFRVRQKALNAVTALLDTIDTHPQRDEMFQRLLDLDKTHGLSACSRSSLFRFTSWLEWSDHLHQELHHGHA